MKLNYSKEAKRIITTLHPLIKREIKQKLGELLDDPYLGKPLKNELDGYWSYRYKRYRVIYKFFAERGEILIYTIGHRRDVYQKMLKGICF